MKARSWWILLVGALIAGAVLFGGCDSHPKSGALPLRYGDDAPDGDRLGDRRPPFDQALVDGRPLGPNGEWLLNASAAVLSIDILTALSPQPDGAILFPSYAAAAPGDSGVLASIDLIDGKAKQFDDGLVAAIHLAQYRGIDDRLRSQIRLVMQIYEKAGPASPAAPYLAAGLELAGVAVPVANVAEKDNRLAEFRAYEFRSKPISFYTWSDELGATFRFARYFQREFDLGHPGDAEIVRAMAGAVSRDAALLADYRRLVALQAGLTNPPRCPTLADIGSIDALDDKAAATLAGGKGLTCRSVSVFPAATSKEGALLAKLFGGGLPPGAELMAELVRRIRSGDIDLAPPADGGWYAHQVHALETLLLPAKGAEGEKLLLTRAYKMRLLSAFRVFLTKRRETHADQFEALRVAGAPPPKPPVIVAPRLRVEPAPTYYLRTARAYAFLANLLEATLGPDLLRGMHGLRQGGSRSQDLRAELHWMQDLFYGLYLLSAEDIGMKATFAADEPVDRERARKAASEWLAGFMNDPDMAVDTRVAIPMLYDPQRDVTRLWVTLGVRLTTLRASYEVPPSIRPASGDGEWTTVEWHMIEPATYTIPVEEFAEVELKGARALSREQLRAIGDAARTRAGILEALQR